MAEKRLPVGPLNHAVPIAEPKTGLPTPEFMRKWNEQKGFNGDINGLLLLELLAGAGLIGGGTLGDFINITFALDPAQPWQPQGFVDGKPDAAQDIFKLATKAGYAIPLDLDGSLFQAKVAAAADAEFTLRKSGVDIGTVTFAAASLTGVAVVPATTFVEGDTFEFIAPAVQDATLADVSFLFLGTRPITV